MIVENKSVVSFMRHSFRGILSSFKYFQEIKIGTLVLPFPRIFYSIYNKELIMNELEERLDCILNENNTCKVFKSGETCKVFTSEDSSRVFNTGMRVALKIKGEVSIQREGVDYSLYLRKEGKKGVKERYLSPVFLKEASYFYYILSGGKEEEMMEEDASSLDLILDIVEFCGGFSSSSSSDENPLSLNNLLSEWKEVLDYKLLVEQGMKVLSIIMRLKYPCPEKHVFSSFSLCTSLLKERERAFCITHDNVINCMVRSMFPTIEEKEVAPLEQLLFCFSGSLIEIYSVYFKVNSNGSYSLTLERKKLGVFSSEVFFQKYPQTSLPSRILI